MKLNLHILATAIYVFKQMAFKTKRIAPFHVCSRSCELRLWYFEFERQCFLSSLAYLLWNVHVLLVDFVRVCHIFKVLSGAINELSV